MVTCVLTPYQLAFGEDADWTMIGIDFAINICFLIDIIINFTSAFYDDEYNLIDDHKVTNTIVYHPFMIGHRMAVSYLVVPH
jgi:hypothetical protein